MLELVRTNDPVLLSFLESLMKEAGIHYMIADQSMSILDGSLGMLPRRFLVDSDAFEAARRIVIDVDLEHELKTPG
jgi:Putative prokaryotic signal transducing protein